jgi:hypothetical protein
METMGLLNGWPAIDPSKVASPMLLVGTPG